MKKYLIFETKDFLKIPNLLSVFRLLLIPLFVGLYLNNYKGWSVLVLIVSGLSDIADGIIARKFDMITDLGKVLDPFADKLNQCAIAVCLAFDFVQLKFLLILFIIKECLMIIGGFILLKNGNKPIASMWWGKISTIVIYITMGLILLFGNNIIGFVMPEAVINILVGLAVLSMIFSFANYIPMFINISKKY